MSIPKKHHYVPVTYLQSWAVAGDIFTCKKDKLGIIRKQNVKSVATKKNLYLLNEKFGEQRLVIEKMILTIFEGRWSDVKKVLNNGKFLHTVSRQIMSYVICQAFRTPKFYRQNILKLERHGVSSEIGFAEFIAVQLMKIYVDFIKNSTCEIVQPEEIGSNFITCDNPATHWIKDGEIYHHLNGIVLTPDIVKNPNYKIICPIHPKYCAIVSPNINMNISDYDREAILVSKQPKSTIIQINNMISFGADQMLFARSVNDLIF